MSAGQLILYVAADVLLLFGALYLWGSFNPQGQVLWTVAGLISIGLGLGLIWLGARHRRS